MKKINLLLLTRTLITSFFLMLCSFGMSAQKITNWTVKYDNSFNAVIKVTVQNNSKKTITAIKFICGSKPKYVSNTNFFSDKNEVKSFTCTIYPNGSSTFEIPVKLQEDYIVKGVIIDVVRYSDGTLRY